MMKIYGYDKENRTLVIMIWNGKKSVVTKKINFFMNFYLDTLKTTADPYS